MTFLRIQAISVLSAFWLGAPCMRALEPLPPADAALAARSFVDQSQIISNFTKEQYAHQSTMRIIQGMAYVVYQCNETSPDENVKGQVARMAIFNLLNPAASARWVDISSPLESSNGITLTGAFVTSPVVHRVSDEVLRIFFASKIAGDTTSTSRVFYKDYHISTGELSGLHQVKCTVAKKSELRDLEMPVVQEHLNFLFGAGFGANFSKGINLVCDPMEIDGQLYSTIQIKNSADGKTLLLTNVLMRSKDNGATWELLGAPDPRLLPGELSKDVKILAEPAMTHDGKNIYLHLRSNVATTGYVLCKASKTDLFQFDAPVIKWPFGIGRPAICDFGKPIGVVAMFTAPTVSMGGTSVSRNRCDVVAIDPSYSRYTWMFAPVDFNAVNTPFITPYNDEMYVSYSTGKRRLIPKFGTSEIVFTKLRREFFFPSAKAPGP